HRFDGEIIVGGQEHFYLESQAAIAYPEEQARITVLSSTQHPSEVQAVVAEILGLPYHLVTVQCRRMGGGFGGKETQAAQPAAMAALVAWHTGRPARIVLGRDDDMAITGKRHPFLARYRVGYSRAGAITALDLDLFANGGCSTDLSPSVLERAMLHVDNAYFLPAVRIVGRVCRTNLPSNTAFRGFGGPQGVACIENILEEIAHRTGRDAYDVRQLNCYGPQPRDRTPYGQVVYNNVLPELMAQLRSTSQYDQRRSEIDLFNSRANIELRGLAMTAVKFGISFTKRTLNQANALVHIYTDGSVLVSTGATEMGQGVHTRIRQLVADDLGIPWERVAIGVTSTDKNHNTSPTAASCGTDLNGAAALDATFRLRARLAQLAARQLAEVDQGLTPSAEDLVFADGWVADVRAPHRRIAFDDVVLQAYQERISLGERGFYATPGVDFDRETGQGTPFLYYTNGAAVAEVIIDRVTGELRVPRVDLLMDIGMPINPGIDRGQIPGGFIQGLGWVTSEELMYDAEGSLLSHSPTTYKIPNVSDVPLDFRV
ncbi:MAG TPA: molybdopterin cofactor-binding domain-containing protein, partial [Pirellulaceae bacterium]